MGGRFSRCELCRFVHRAGIFPIRTRKSQDDDFVSQAILVIVYIPRNRSQEDSYDFDMDPTSALGLAAACLGIVTKLGVTINTLHNLRGKYKNSDRTISFFIIHLTTLRSASNRLSDWIEQSSLTTLSVGEKVDLQQSVDACNALVEMIDLYVSRVGKGSGPFSFGSRVRFLWDEAEIREAREILQLQVQALMFQFQIIQL